MPIYKDYRLKSFRETGLMEFLKYPDFHARYKEVGDAYWRNVFSFIYFTGARMSEVIRVQRKHFLYQGAKVTVQIETCKHTRVNKKTGEVTTDHRVRPVDIPLKYPETKKLWEFVKDMPDDFYIFGSLRLLKNPRVSFIRKIGLPAYYLRHNTYSLAASGGATKLQIKQMKGAMRDSSVECYLHLSEEERKDTVKKFIKGIEK